MSPRIPMKTRNVRVPDKDWDAAHVRAELLGENLSEKIREFIRAYPRDGLVILESSDIEFLLWVLDDKIPELSDKSSPRLDALRDGLRLSIRAYGKGEVK